MLQHTSYRHTTFYSTFLTSRLNKSKKLGSGVTIDPSNAVIAAVSDDHTAVFIDFDARGMIELSLVARAVLEA